MNKTFVATAVLALSRRLPQPPAPRRRASTSARRTRSERIDQGMASGELTQA